MTVEELYGLNYPVKSFAISNEFVTQTNKACYKLGQNLTPFCLYANDKQKEYSVLDFATFNGFLDTTKSLIDEIVAYRENIYRESNIYFDMSDDIKKKLILYDYLMSVSVCYVEVPKWTTKNGISQESYDKYLVTKNPTLMGTWMGQSASEMQVRYSSRIVARQLDYNNNEIKFAKLGTSKKGNSITVPRSSYKVDKMKCVPLYMLYAFIEGFKPLLRDNIVKFSYLKDNGTIRELATTLNEGILTDYYHDNMFISTMLGSVDINTVQQGGLMLSSKMHRGYIKVPEVGASRFDDTGARSLNIARILKAEIVPEVDRTFIDVNLKQVESNAIEQLEYAYRHTKDEMKLIYKELTGNDDLTDESESVILNKCEDYIRTNVMILSTTYLRLLHIFMLDHMKWFPKYLDTLSMRESSNIIYNDSNGGVLPVGFD